MNKIFRWLKDPLVHFLVLGGALFALYGAVGGSDEPTPDQIIVSDADIERLATLFRQRWQRPPTSAELDGLIEAHLREEILYREALALGLDRDDTIVRRRMAQKLEFLFRDLAVQAEPTEEELDQHLKANPDRFTEPARVAFAHVYLNPDKRGGSLEEDARVLLAALREGGSGEGIDQLGDRFMLDSRYDTSEDQVARLFGRDFAARVVALEPGDWRGPVESGYGIHLVQVERMEPPYLPPLEAVRDSVRLELMAEREKEANESFYEELRKRYQIEIAEGADTETVGAQ